MRIYDLIAKKRDGFELSTEEINWLIAGYVAGSIKDYQMSAFLMAVYFNSMSDSETLAMTMAMAKSGAMLDLSQIDGIKVDKHSTGGVGDKTTLIVAPIVAACGVKVAKMSGRSLGHTGGTIDKLEAIPNFRTTLTKAEFVDIVNTVGTCVMGQSENVAPADKLIYALRDATATVESIPLIAASIMSKKLASGSDCILLDVKTGSGAFMKTFDDSVALAQKMVAIGENAGKKTIALITNMDIPLGNNIGNSLEITESVSVLRGDGAPDLMEVCLTLAENMLFLAGKGDVAHCRQLAEDAISSGAALSKLAEMVKTQSGDEQVILNTDLLKQASYSHDVIAIQSGYISAMNAEDCGITSLLLGAGRDSKEDEIDYSAGVIMHKKTGDFVNAGDVLATLYTCDKSKIHQAQLRYLNALKFSATSVSQKAHVLAKIALNSTKIY